MWTNQNTVIDAWIEIMSEYDESKLNEIVVSKLKV
jgi:hypothetical protein